MCVTATRPIDVSTRAGMDERFCWCNQSRKEALETQSLTDNSDGQFNDIDRFFCGGTKTKRRIENQVIAVHSTERARTQPRNVFRPNWILCVFVVVNGGFCTDEKKLKP
jgi:hypothetical protein